FFTSLPSRLLIGSSFLWLLGLSTFVLSQEQEIAPAASLIAEGIPKIPSAIADEVGRYRKGRGADFLSWNPAKKEMLIATFFGNVSQIHLVKFPGGARTQLTFFDDRPTRGVSFQPKSGSYFIFTKDKGGDQNNQIFRYDYPSGEVTLLTDGKSKNSAG